LAEEKKLRGALGFAMKAGKCAAGDFAAEKLVKSAKARLVALDAGASENTRQRYTGMCERAGIPLIEIEDMGAAIGKPGRMIAAVTDEGFARMIAAAKDAARQEKDKGVE
jgi:ribosomal protein L7Ae-like RNA K-turn-binding protein